MQSVEFTVAFLNSMLSAIHQHVNFKDLKERKQSAQLVKSQLTEIVIYHQYPSAKNDSSQCTS